MPTKAPEVQSHRGRRCWLPVAGAFVGKFMHKKVDKGADLGLCETARRIDGIDALGFLWQLGNGVFDQPFVHCVSVKEAWQVSDAKTGNRRVQQGLPIVDRKPSRSAHLAFFTRWRSQFPDIATGLVGIMQQLVIVQIAGRGQGWDSSKVFARIVHGMETREHSVSGECQATNFAKVHSSRPPRRGNGGPDFCPPRGYSAAASRFHGHAHFIHHGAIPIDKAPEFLFACDLFGKVSIDRQSLTPDQRRSRCARVRRRSAQRKAPPGPAPTIAIFLGVAVASTFSSVS
ncbi:hypothetical protein GQR58_030698 [Nymphon striatum]|nr:hypothetical protein GQR58_030698 [Nymphon striatum]